MGTEEAAMVKFSCVSWQTTTEPVSWTASAELPTLSTKPGIL